MLSAILRQSVGDENDCAFLHILHMAPYDTPLHSLPAHGVVRHKGPSIKQLLQGKA